MKIFKDKKIIALCSILLLFTIFYFVSIFKISYAFQESETSKYVYDKMIETIKLSAEKYAKENANKFKEEDTIYLKIQDLIDANLLATNSEGNIVNPTNKDDILNTKVLKIKKEDKNYIVEIDG